MSDQSKSAALYERALRVLPGGVSRNTVLRTPHPLYADYASGRVWAVNTADDSDPIQLLQDNFFISSFAELPDGDRMDFVTIVTPNSKHHPLAWRRSRRDFTWSAKSR